MFLKVRRVHFVGVGGIGMSGIAEVLLNLGHSVSGSDLHLTSVTERLSSLGAKIFEGHSKENIGDAEVVIISSAIREDNPEVISAKEKGIPLLLRAEMLAELMRLKSVGIAIAGTHGKTTTTSMIGQVVQSAGFDPTLIVGGVVKGIGSNAKIGTGQILICEADEFDRSFLRLLPTIAVVTTIEAEHLDCYRNIDEIKNAFIEFANKVPFYGAIILCLDERGNQEIISSLRRRTIGYGLSRSAEFRAEGPEFSGLETDYTVIHNDKNLGKVHLRVPGIHNVKNSLAAIATGIELDIPFSQITDALGEFRGVYRRFEIKGEKGEILVVDDYAHHPTEIEVTLRAARNGFKRRVVAVFQPHLYSRTKDFSHEFGGSFGDADVLVVTDVYPAREEPISGVSGALIADAAEKAKHKEVYYIPDKREIPQFLRKKAKSGDMVITMGAGDIWKVGEAFLRDEEWQ